MSEKRQKRPVDDGVVPLSVDNEAAFTASLEAPATSTKREKERARASRRRRGWIRRHGAAWYWCHRGERGADGKVPEYRHRLDRIENMTRAEARAAGDKLADDLLPLEGMTRTWSGWCKRYLTIYVASIRKQGTRSVTQSIVINHLKAAFGKRHLNEIRKAHVQNWLASMTAAGAAADTVRHRYRVLVKMLKCALGEGLAVEIPRDVDLPTSDRVLAPSLMPYTSEEIELVLEAASEPLKTIVMLCALVNLRIGETLGLRVEDIDLKARRLRVIRQTQRGRITALKTASSTAVEHRIGPKLAGHIGAYLSTHPGAGFLFPSPRLPDRPRHETGIRRAFNDLLEELNAKIPGRAFHGARRWFGTEGARDGAPLPALQRAMRHGDARSTQRYVRMDTSDADAVIERVEARLFKGKRPRVVRLVRNGRKVEKSE